MIAKGVAVARWEFIRAVVSRQFLVTTLLVPLIVLVVGAVPHYTEQAQSARVLVVGVVHTDAARLGLDEPTVLAALEAQNVYLQPTTSVEEGERRVAEGEVDALLLARESSFDYQLVIREVNAAAQRAATVLAHTLTGRAVLTRAAELGLTPSQAQSLTAPVAVELRVVRGGTPNVDWVPLVFASMLMLSIFFSGNVLMQSVIKEKQNRIVEILFSSAPPVALMGGKIAAFACLAFIQVLLWSAVGLLVGTWFWNVSLGDVATVSVLLGLPFFVAGYLLYAAMFASLGAATRDAQAGGQAQGVLVIVPLIPLMLAGPILMDPSALWVKVLGFIPIFTPGTFLLRLSVGHVPPLEYALAVAVLALSAWFALRTAVRVFFWGMLMTGRPATIREIGRWIFGR